MVAVKLSTPVMLATLRPWALGNKGGWNFGKLRWNCEKYIHLSKLKEWSAVKGDCNGGLARWGVW
jgi:hypothetical protein